MKERTIDAIYLCPNDNMQGNHVCMNLSTGKRITRNKITPVPLSEVVKNRVEQMAVDQGITHVKFTNKKGIELPNADWIAGVDYDIDYDEINDNDKDDTYEYQQNVDENLNPNDMWERTIDAIYLCPNNNIQGGHVCMNLSTGNKLQEIQ